MPPKLLVALSCAALLVAAGPAEARVGKRSNAPASPNGAHAATPVANNRGGRAVYVAPAYSAPRRGPDHVRPFGWNGGRRGYGYAPVYVAAYAAAPVYATPVYTAPVYPAPVYVRPTYAAPAPALEESREEPAARVRVALGAEGMAFPGGASAGLTFGLEGERWGFSSAYNFLRVGADDSSGGTDTLQQLNAHLTYALLAGSRGRLRVEAGADSVFAPQLMAMGPSLGASGVLWLGGPFALEGAVSVTPFPYRQVEARAGVALGLGPVGLRGGWRTLYLDDAGMSDGSAHQDLFSGPYVGLGLAL